MGRLENARPNSAFRWTESDGFQPLGDLAGGSNDSIAFAISSDGSTIVGRSDSSNGEEAYVWRESHGMMGIGDLPGGDFESTAWHVSATGRFAVGQ